MRFSARALGGLALLGALLAVLPGCDEDGEPGPAITGVLRDATGQPLSGAGVVLEYRELYSGLSRARPTTQIQFQVPEAGHVRVWITAPGVRRAVRVLCDGELPAGAHGLPWDGADGDGVYQVPGLYDVHVLVARVESTFEIFWQDVPFEELATLEGREWHAFTRADGSLRIPLEGLAFGATFGDASVAWAARVWAVSPGRGAVVSAAWVAVDPQMGAQVELSYPEEPE